MTAASDEQDPALPPAPVPGARMAAAILALVGALISAYLLMYHFHLVGRLFCGADGSCETVQNSPWASFLGIPVAGLGLLGYLGLLGLALAGLQPGLVRDRRITLAMLLLTLVAVAFTAYLNALEAFVIHAWCRWCLASAAIIVLLLVCSLIDLRRLRAGGVTAPPGTAGDPGPRPSSRP